MTTTIVKTVKKYGNSGGIYLPNSWIGGKVKVEMMEEPINPKEILNKIDLKHVISLILYGSYARKETSSGSDMDIILVTDEDADTYVPGELMQRYDIQVKTAEQARNAMVHDPLFHKAIIDESAALINHQFLESLRKETLKPDGISSRIGLAESSLKITSEIFDAGGLAETIYPLVMRLKEMLILECLIENKKYSTKVLRKEILNCGISPKEFLDIMDIYRSTRDSKKPRSYFLSEEMVKKMISLLEAKVKYVRQKTLKKGHRIP